MPLLSRIRVLASKIETTVGTAESLTAAEGAFNAFDVVPQSTRTMSQRNKQGSFGGLAAINDGDSGTVTFMTELQGDGAGGVPTWASTFLPSCGWVDSLGTFSAVSAAPGTSGVKTSTIGVYENGLYKELYGAMGSWSLAAPTGKIAMMEWTYTGIWSTPSDVAIIAPTYPTELPLRARDATLTIGGWSPCMENMTIESGNEVTLRPCSSQASGFISALVGNRLPTGTMNPESTLVATNDTYTDWENSVEKSFSWDLENATDKITFSSSNFQITNVQESDRGGNQVDDVTFQFNDDDLDIIFAAP